MELSHDGKELSILRIASSTDMVLKLLEMSSNTCLQSSSIDNEVNLKVPNHFVASFRPLASASLGYWRPVYQDVLALMNYPLRHIPTP
ncbi:hypothetical protein MTR_2g095340 [Medicago truncatula]|uniref:Uncharacterized protein n=1 Tax=Medicago truncatula TaxID=3880 RepID=G8A159_MEDTR|nr:hypothetical protein MTR_2g095340 [Medicago truncatula]